MLGRCGLEDGGMCVHAAYHSVLMFPRGVSSASSACSVGWFDTDGECGEIVARYPTG